MLSRRHIALAFALASLAFGANAAFAHHAQVPFAEVAQSSDLIFVGTVASQTSRADDAGSMVFTDVTFADVEMVNASGRSRQKAASTITLTFPGGTVGDLTVSLCDSARFETGRRYLLCALDDGRAYSNPLVGGPQGLFEVVRDLQTGEEFVLTAGRRAVVGQKGARLVTTEARILAFENGAPVPDRGPDSGRMSVEAPISADGTPARASEFQTSDAEARPMSLRLFVDHVKNVALKTRLRERAIRTGESGRLFHTAGGKVVAEPLKRPAPSVVAPASEPAAFKAPEIPRAGAGPAPAFAPNGAGARRGGPLTACGYQDLFIVMEQYPSNWAEFGIANDCLWVWNQSRDVFRYVDDDGSFRGGNGVNEFTGYPSDADLMNNYGWGWGPTAVAVTAVYGGDDCTRITEADVSLNPAYSWSTDPHSAIGSSAYLIRPTLMHEIGHVWGEMSGTETYDYDIPSVMHAAYNTIVEDGWGVHWPDAQLIRAIYDWQAVGADVGVESYYAANGLNESTISGTSFAPGDAITLNRVTVENMSNFPISDVRIRFYLSRDKFITTGDIQMGSDWSWATFGAESYNVFDYPMTVPTGIAGGTYYVGAIVTINGFGDDAMTLNNATYFADTITVRSLASPFIDRITGVTVAGRPWKLKLFGGDFQPGVRVFIGEDGVEWGLFRLKSSGLLVLKGGDELLEWFPEGAEVPIRLVNPDGGETVVTFTR